MTDLKLRDACKHGRYEKHMTHQLPLGSTNDNWCPGGRDITIDSGAMYRAAWDAFANHPDYHPDGTQHSDELAVQAAVDAAFDAAIEDSK